MKRTQTIVAIVAIFLCLLCGCVATPKYVKIIFRQDGFSDVVRNIPYGQDVTGIPTPQPVTGYDVSWENKNLSSVTQDTIVHAVLTPKEYTVTLDPNGGYCSQSTVKFKYGFAFSLPVPSRNDFVFVGWFNGESRFDNGVWNTDSDVTLTAKWASAEEFIVVTFRQQGFADRTVQTARGTRPEIPEPQAVRGYTVKWQTVDWSKVDANIVVEAELTPNKYTITYELGGKNDAIIETYTQQVTFDSVFSLLEPQCETAKFVRWIEKQSGATIEDGVWSIDGNVTLVAVWEDEQWSDFH